MGFTLIVGVVNVYSIFSTVFQLEICSENFLALKVKRG